MKKFLLIASSLLFFAIPAHANILNIGASSIGPTVFQGLPPDKLSVLMNLSGGTGNLQGDRNLGFYIFGAPFLPGPYIAGPASVTGVFPIPNIQQTFGYFAADGFLEGNVTWTELEGSTSNALFLGTFKSTGNRGVFSNFNTGLVVLTTTFLNIPSLIDLAASGKERVGFNASGSIEQTASGVPGPVIGAGLPGLIFASGSLLVWWRRKRRAHAVA
jgi:hypothetical protein